MHVYLKISIFVFSLIIIALANGCQYKGEGLEIPCLPYQTNIEQGRIIDTKKIKLLKKELTFDQVKMLLGKPTIIKGDTWEYFHYCKKPNEGTKVTKLTLQFIENKLKIWYKNP